MVVRGLGALGLLGIFTLPAYAQSNPKLDALKGVEGGEKIESRLRDAALGSSKRKSALSVEFTGVAANKAADGGIYLEATVTETTDEVIKKVEAAGVEVVYVSKNHPALTLKASNGDAVLALGAIDEITVVRPVYQPRTHVGSVRSGAEDALFATQLATRFLIDYGLTVDGTGQTVGILSDSFSGARLTAGQASGDLPGSVTILADTAGSDEGAAMAELVHDLAPGAAIKFHTAFVSESNFADGIDLLAANGCTVITDDVIYFAEPVFQDGAVAQAAARAVAGGIPFYSAAGNFANDALRSTFNDVDGADDIAVPPTGKDLHRWANGTGFLPITLPPGGAITIFLQWNQPFASLGLGQGAQIDLDMFFCLSPDGAGLTEVYSAAAFNEGRRSNTIQGNTGLPSGDPIEVVGYQNLSSSNKTLYLAIDHYYGSQGNIPQANIPLELNVLFVRESENIQIQGIDPLNNSTGGRTIFGHAVAEGVTSVGAVNYLEVVTAAPNYWGPTPELDPEPFTAKGGTTHIPFDGNGFYNPRTSFEPDIACVDGTNTTFFGGADFDLDGNPNFRGTSAAAPNAAAIAALLKQINPSLAPAQINYALTLTATDVKGLRAAPGRDDVSGVGLINALKAAEYVADNFGVAVGLPSPDEVSFDFVRVLNPGEPTELSIPDSQGWVAEFPPGFTSPGFSNDVGNLNLAATNSFNTLGWYKSPDMLAIALDPDLSNPPIGINALNGPNSIFRALYRVGSDTNNAAIVPAFRMRQSTRSFEQSDMLVVTSTGHGPLSPTASATRDFLQYFALPPTQNRFNLYFDLLGFPNGDDAGGVTLKVDKVIIDNLSIDNLIDGRLETLVNFAGNTRGWTKRDVPGFGSVQGSGGAKGITLGPANNGNATTFGFWSGPDGDGEIMLGVNRIYRVVFRVSSSADADHKAQLPTFRLRANDSSNALAVLMDITATSSAANVPSGGTTVDYVMYFQTPTPLAGNKVRFSFDYLYVPGTGKDSSQKVTLESFRVDSFNSPPNPI